MPRFQFEVVDRLGSKTRGIIHAPTRTSAVDQLLANGQTPILLNYIDGERSLREAFLTLSSKFDYLRFLRQFGLLLSAGLSVERALNVMQSLNPSSRSVHRVGQLVEQVRSGRSISQAFSQTVPEAPSYVWRLIAAGEVSGHLSEVVQRLSENLSRSKKLRDKLISDLTYPVILILTIAIVLWVIFAKVLPRLTPMFADAGAALPLPTRILVDAAWFFDKFGWILLIGLLSAIGALIYSLKNKDRRTQIDRLLVTKPWFLGLPAHYEAAKLCRNLQTLLHGGLPLDRALLAARDGSGNAWFRDQIGLAQRRISDGDRLGRALASLSFLPPLVIEFASVGEETGRLQNMMGEAATILDHDIETKLSRLSALVLPGATLILGALVGSIMAGIVSGMIAVNNLVG